jgi:hypothetical protein
VICFYYSVLLAGNNGDKNLRKKIFKNLCHANVLSFCKSEKKVTK